MPLSVRDEFATLFQTLLVEIGVFLSRQQARKKKRKEKKPKLDLEEEGDYGGKRTCPNIKPE